MGTSDGYLLERHDGFQSPTGRQIRLSSGAGLVRVDCGPRNSGLRNAADPFVSQDRRWTSHSDLSISLPWVMNPGESRGQPPDSISDFAISRDGGNNC